jgi:hypothetical protein
MTAQSLYIVSVHDAINDELAGHRGCAYRSPPQTHSEAVALVELLLGSHVGAAREGSATWTRSVAGGRRTITLTPAVHPVAQQPQHDAERTRRDSQRQALPR